MSGWRINLGVLVIGVSREDPPRLWFQVAWSFEVRFYLFGVELLIGPPTRMISLEAGTLGCHADYIRNIL